MRKTIHLLLVSAMLLVPAVAWGQAGTGISGTAHDFANIGTPGTGLCTFCHTPHKAQSTLLIWNHTLSTNNFAWDEPATTAGTTFPSFAGDTYNGPTTKCLSCHDGSVAVGDIGWWNGGDPGSLLNVVIGEGDAFNVGFGGDMAGNHPVAMPIPFNNQPGSYNGATTGAGITLADWKADPTTLGIVLYNDDGAGNITRGAVAGQTGIECGSCHDPHNGSNVQDSFFLYGILGGSTADYICIKCHTKE
jgi:hypothetical protein